jgi:drug/metabolite transporter (DMT)-like permease
MMASHWCFNTNMLSHRGGDAKLTRTPTAGNSEAPGRLSGSSGAWWALHHGSSLLRVAPQTPLFNAVFQGVVAALLGLWTISAAIIRLGAAQAAAFGALAPVVSALGGWLLLGDALSALDGFAVGCAVMGVVMAAALRKFRQGEADSDIGSDIRRSLGVA